MRLQLLPALAVSAGVLVAGCSDDDNKVTTPDPEVGTVMISMEHVVGDDALLLDQINFTNAAGNQYSVETLKYYLCDVFVMGPDGRFDAGNVQFVDAREHGTHTIMIEGIPQAHYDALGFTFGLNPEFNSDETMPEDARIPDMGWPEVWGGGYHYMKLEGDYLDSKGGDHSYTTHTGRYHNEDEGRLHEEHFVPYILDLHQNINDGETLHVTLTMDINEFYEGEHEIDLSTQRMMMANKELQDEIEANCTDLFTLEGGGSHDDHGDGF